MAKKATNKSTLINKKGLSNKEITNTHSISEIKEKRKALPETETIISGIGQGYYQVTPLQLARATATLANRGDIVTPFLVDKIVTAQAILPGPETHQRSIPLHSNNINTIVEAMVNVVHSARGTAKRINQDINYQIAGKTGTAQVLGIKQNAKYNENDIDIKYRDHALFISFAPADDPKIAVAVVVENGGHGGSVAAPIAGQVIKQFLKEKDEH